jgi:polyvinyl alcohol dehydrogenase (cytochrome)
MSERTTGRAVLWTAIATGTLMSFASLAFGGDWTMGGDDLNNSRYQGGVSINANNVGSLKPKWVFTTGGDVTATPAVTGGLVYFPDWAGNYYALDKNSGALKWSGTVSGWTGVPNDYARNDPAVDANLLIIGDQAGALATLNQAGGLVGAGARVIAINKDNGSLMWSTQVDAFPAAFVTSSPVIYNGVVYVGVATAEETTAALAGYPCCTSSGSVVALNENTGKILWQTKTVPTSVCDSGGCYSGGSVWDSTPVIDTQRNLIYVGTGNNFSVPGYVKTCFANNNNDPNCAVSNDYFDSVLALDLKTGVIKWSTRGMYYDDWNVACLFNASGTGSCPSPEGMDYDFGGAGPNRLTLSGNSNLIGIGGKSGIYWAVNPDTGSVAWETQVGPGSSLGGIEWGTAFDGTRIYVPIANAKGVGYSLQGGAPANSGSWAALDPATGKILWQTATPGSCITFGVGTPQGCMALGPASAIGGVVFVGSMDTNPANPTMFALNAATGNVLWSYVAGSSVNAGPATDGAIVFWGSGYSHFGPLLGTGNNKLFAFSVNGQ